MQTTCFYDQFYKVYYAERHIFAIMIKKLKQSINTTLWGVLVLVALVVPVQAEAATVLIGDKISIEADEVIEDDYYVSVGTLGSTVMSGTIEGDMYTVAGSVTTNGVIKGDFGALAGLSYMHASVTDDVRIVAGEVVIDDYVGGDVFVIAGKLNILSTAQIEGDVIFYGFEGEISGTVGGSVYGTTDTLRVDTKIAGDIDVTANRELTLGSKAEVGGNIRYRSRNELVRAQDATITGEVQKQAVADNDEENALRSILVPMFISLFAALTLYLLFKREMQKIILTVLESPVPSGLIGLSTLVAGPFVSLLLISTVLGMLLGVFGVGVMLVLVSVGFALAVVLTGALASRVLISKATVSLPWILGGAVIFHGVLQIPMLGLLVALTLISVTIGAMLLSLYRNLK